MADVDTTPLLQADHLSAGLPVAYGQPQDHPSFLRACHSPWRWLDQKALCWIRGSILVYLIAVGILIIDFKVETKSDFSDWRIVFQYDFITFGLVLSYHAVVFEYQILRGMSLPSNMASLRKQFYFTLFYFTTCVFATVNTILYWFVTLPHNDSDGGSPPSPQPSGVSRQAYSYSPMRANEVELQMTPTVGDFFDAGKTPFTDLLGEGWFKAFIYINLFAITTGIMLFEIFFLNSIKRPWALADQMQAVGAHIFGLLFFSGLYIGWASVGKVLTGADAFFWLNEDDTGSREAVVANCLGFVLLSPVGADGLPHKVYSLIYGFIAIRETVNKSAIVSRINRAAAQAAADHTD
ncbi:hypothetical protein F5X68DRAFT_245184 [Plectosphaerella plurivora]|uniref:Uncharacterized protein n=1 Tax=Plectosphaerella plurivora TaxID=936078 RepID=A0A9P8V665_9PEZI|nr:hypothetical protein F5X68DRAFT_245184 [Plectosphaerella plurivora]